MTFPVAGIVCAARNYSRSFLAQTRNCHDGYGLLRNPGVDTGKTLTSLFHNVRYNCKQRGKRQL